MMIFGLLKIKFTRYFDNNEDNVDDDHHHHRHVDDKNKIRLNYLPCFKIAEFFSDNFASFYAKSINNSLGKIWM